MAEKPAKPTQIHMTLDAEEIERVDDFRFANRMATRAAAIRELIRLGLDAAGQGKG